MTRAESAAFVDAFNKKQSSKKKYQEKWYVGNSPTYMETLGKIYSMKNGDTNSQVKADTALSMLHKTRKDRSSPLYSAYSSSTSSAASKLTEMGYNTDDLTEDWYNNNWGAIRSYLVYDGATNTPKSPTKNSTAEETAAYWLNKYYQDEQQTKTAESEWQAAQDEVKYLAGRTDLNYSDDQILSEFWKTFDSKYPTLSKMRSDADKNAPTALTRAVDFSEDGLKGAIWEARNPDYTGDLEGAMAYSYLGYGNQWKYDPEIAAKLNQGDESTYSPYSVGMTGAKTNAAGLYFNMPSFTQEWLDQNKERILNGDDEQAKKYYSDILDAEQTTQQAETELANLNAKVDKWISQGLSDSEIEKRMDQLLQGSDYATLRKMDSSIATGLDEDVLNMTRAVPYRKADIIQDARDRIALRDGTDDRNKTLAKLQIPDMNAYGKHEQEKWEKDHPGKDAETEAPAIQHSPMITQTTGEQMDEEAKNRKSATAISILYDSLTPSEQKHFDAQPSVNGSQTAQTLYEFKNTKVGESQQTKNYGPYNPEIFEDPTWASRMAAQLAGETDDKYSSVAYDSLELRTNYESVQEKRDNLAEQDRMLNEEYQDLVLAHEPIPYEPLVQIGGEDGPEVHFKLKEDGTYELDTDYELATPVVYEYLAMNDMTMEEFTAQVEEQRVELDAKADRIRKAKEATYQADPYAAAQQERFYESLPDAKVVFAQLAQCDEYLANNKADYDAASEAVKSVDTRRTALRKVMGRSGVLYTETKVLDSQIGFVSNFTNYKSSQANADGTIGELEAAFGGRALTEEDEAGFKAYIEKLQADVDDAKFMMEQDHVPENYQKWMGQYVADTEKQIRMHNAYLVTKQDDFDELVNTGKGEYWTAVAEAVDSPDASPSNGVNKTGWSLMTELEQNVYYAMYAKEGAQAADQYYTDLEPSLLIRSKEGLARNAEARAKSGVFGRMANIAIDIGLAAVEAPASLLYLAGSALHGEDNDWLMIPGYAAKQSYGQTVEELHRIYKDTAPALDTIFTGITEMIHNRGRSAVMGALYGPLFPAGTNEVFLAMPMATTAMADALDEAFDRGATPAQAWTLAAINFLAESVTEGLELKHMKEAYMAGTAGKYTIKDFLLERIPEGVSEMLGEVTNNIVERTADRIIMGENSNHAAAVQAYIDQGYMPDDAEMMANVDEFKDDIHTALVSFASSYLDLGAFVGGKMKTDWQYMREVDSLRRQGDATTTIHDLRVRDQQGAEALQQAMDGAQDAILNRELRPISVKEEGTQANAQTLTEDQQAALQNLKAQQTEYDTDITILANSSDSDHTTITATIASILRTGDMNAEQAMAAAESIGDVLGEDAIGDLLELWEGGVVSGADINTLRTGLQYAALADGRCRAMITGEAGNAYTLGTPESKVSILAEAVQEDMADANVQEQVSSAVHEYRVAEAEHQLLAEGDYSERLDAAEARISDAETKLNIAVDRLQKQQSVETTTAQAVAEAGEALANNPNPDNAKALANELNKALEEEKSQTIVTQEYEQSVENARRNEQKVREETDKETGEIRAEVRQQAEAIVAQQDQERAEAAAQQAEQERIAAEEAARLQAEEDERTGKAQEMREDAAIEEAVANENLDEEAQEQRTDELKDQRDKVKAVLTDLDQPLTNAEGMLQLAAFERRLGIPIKFADLGPVNQKHITRGKYENGVIYLNQNLVKEGKLTVGQALVEASLHEIIHGVRDTNAYNGYRDVVLQQMFGMDGSMNTQSLYENNSDFRAAIDAMIEDRADANDPNFTGDKTARMIELAEEEIVADFARKNLAEKDVAQRLVDCGVGGKVRNILHNINQKMKNYLSNMTGEERQTAENLRRAERNLQKAIEEAAKNSAHPEGTQFSISQFAESAGLNFDQNTLELRDKDGNIIDGVNYKVTADMMNNTPVGLLIDLARDGAKTQKGNVKFNSTISAETAQAQKQMFADLMNMVAQYRDSNLVWEIASSTMFSAMKSNSDPQYSTTVDFGTVCAKTQEIINVMSRVMLEKGRGLTREEVLKVYNETANAGLTVPCPVCYVFSRWMGVPSLLNQMSQYQERFVKTNEDGTIDVDATQKEANKYIKAALKKYGSKDKIDDAKISITNRMKTQEKNRTDALTVLNSETATADEKAKAQTKHDAAIKQLDILQKDLGEVEAYNWVTQALCLQKQKGKTKYNVLDSKGNYVVDSSFEVTPKEVLFDLRRTGEFAKYAKNWQYRNTRGAGMGKAIMPYSGESIGDIIYGTTRKSDITNPFLTMVPSKAADGIKDAVARARKQNLIGGQRLQSTSDFRPEWGLDYMMSFLELQAVGSKVQMYTKVAEAVDLLASMGADVNLSIMGKGQGWHTDENGNAVLDFSDVTGMNYETARALKDKYDNVQMILVGMNDTHIKLAMANKDIDFIIPWHSSGNSKDTLSSLISSVGESLETSSDYTDTQSDQVSENQTAEQKQLWDLRMKILQGKKLTEEDRRTIYADKEYLMPLYERFNVKGKDDDCYQVKLGKDQAKQIFPYEYWNKSLTKDQANGNGQAFIDYCNHFGIVPRFSGVVKHNDDGSFSVTGNFAGAIYDENGNITGYDPDQMYDGYWKVLIDRSMYDNAGNYRDQQVVDVTKAKIGGLENGKLTGSDMPLTTSAMYGPNYSELEKTAVDNSLAAIEEQAVMNSGKQSVMGDLTQADRDLMQDAVTDYADAVARGDMKAAQEDVDFYAEQKGYTYDAFHGSPVTNITSFDKSKLGNNTGSTDVPGFFFVDRKDYAEAYLSEEQDIKPEYKERYEEAEAIYDQYHDKFSSLNGYYKIGDSYGEYVQRTHPEKFKGFYDPESQEYRDFERASAFLRNVDDDRLKLNPKYTNTTKQGKVYGVKLKMQNPYIYDAQGEAWNPSFWGKIKQAAASEGGFTYNGGMYDGIIIENFYDFNTGESGTEYVVFDPEQIKSSDPVTYDDNGNVIPLDQRFTDSPDIRYSTEGKLTQADQDLMNTQTLGKAGVLTQEEIDAYRQKTSRPLEGRSTKWTQETGPAQRQFGQGMLQDSDEIDQFVKDYVKERNSMYPDTNEDQVVRAINWIRKNGSERNEDGSYAQKTDGYYESVKKVTSKNFDYRSADGQARMIATMAMAVAKNDVAAQVELADAFNRQGTDLGRALQSRKLFRLMTPEGRIATLQKMIQNTSDELGAKGINADLKFSEWIYRAAAAAVEESDFAKVQQAAASELASQIPANWRDKLRGWRMLSMLGNPRTHIRNIVGNALFVPAVSMKNKLGALMELGVEKGQRTKTLSPFVSSEIRQFAKQDALTMKDTLTGEAKFNETTMVQREQKAFNGLLQAVIDFNGDMLEKEDWIFLKGHYTRALGGWMQANGYTAEQLNADPALLEKGRAYAVQEAQKATYRDFNKLAATLNKVSRDGGVAGFITDAVLPFKKTPANILRRGVEYSPVGIVKSLTADIYHLKQYRDFQNGKLSVLPEKAISPTQFIDDICSGIAGTAVMAAGYLLSRAGVVSCGLGDDDDEFEKAKGNQKYAINPGKLVNSIFGAKILGEDVTYTMDWAAPMSMPFFVGAAIQQQFENEGEYDAEAVLNAFGNITEPVFNLSMLDGVNSLLKISQNNGQDSNTTLTQIGGKIMSNYATSYVPSLFGAIARTIDDKQRKAYVESGKGTGLMGTFRYAVEQTENKIPWLNQTNIPIRDIWGEEQTSSLAERIVENFISPGYIENYREDAVIDEMARLWDSTGDKGLIPDADPDKTITVNKEKRVLTAEQWDQYKENRNKTAHEMLTQLIGSEDYQNATDAAQAQMIKNVWSYADKVGKNAVFPDYELDTKEDPVATAAKEGKVTACKTDMMTSLDSGDYDGYDTMVEALHELGVEDSEIKTKIGNTYRDQYKDAYRKGDEARMAEIEDILDNTGFVFDIEKWERDVDEKYGL